MKKITPLIIVFLFTIHLAISQNISHSASLTIKDNHSISCNTTGIIRANSFSRVFDLIDFGITSSYNITEVQFGIENLIDAPVAGFPITISISEFTGAYPFGTSTLITQVTKMVTDQSLTLYSALINAIIPANSKFVVAISVPSDVVVNGGAGVVRFDIGSNDDGETSPSYMQADACSLLVPVTLDSQGRPDVHLVMNVVGTSATAGNNELDLVSFSYHPNPVVDKLYMKAQEDITSVSLYNMLGQKLKEIQPSQFDAEFDLANLSAGTYFVRATIKDKVGSFKIVKN